MGGFLAFLAVFAVVIGLMYWSEQSKKKRIAQGKLFAEGMRSAINDGSCRVCGALAYSCPGSRDRKKCPDYWDGT